MARSCHGNHCMAFKDTSSQHSLPCHPYASLSSVVQRKNNVWIWKSGKQTNQKFHETKNMIKKTHECWAAVTQKNGTTFPPLKNVHQLVSCVPRDLQIIVKRRGDTPQWSKRHCPNIFLDRWLLSNIKLANTFLKMLSKLFFYCE